MKLLVGVHTGGLSGIETYAEQSAIAAASAGFEVTLLATDRVVTETLRQRVERFGIQVGDLGLRPLTSQGALVERLWPSAAVHRTLRAVSAYAAHQGEAVWHFNRPALALAVRGRAKRICVAGWFYPHQAMARLRETWSHVGGRFVRRTVIAAKSLDFYRWDEAGYRAADRVVVPTELLAAQLRAQGRSALACPPPGAEPPELPPTAPRQGLRFLVCSGDLAHPRKNLREAVDALAQLAQISGLKGPVTLTAVGRNPEPLLRHASRRAPNLRFEALGPLGPAEVRQVMQVSDALLFPSRYEEWGYVATEALLCGTPVVTYPVYPFAEMLSGGLGAVAKSMGATAFAAAIEQALLIPRGKALSAAAAERFGSAAVGRRLAQVWNGGP